MRLLLGLVGLALTGCGDVELASRADASCAELEAGRFEASLKIGEGPIDGSGDGRRLAECRCIAWLSLGEREACTEPLAEMLSQPEARDWVPHPVLAKLMIRRFQAVGDDAQATALARRAAARHPEQYDLLELEFGLRSRIESEDALLAEGEDALRDDLASLPRRLLLAQRWLARSQWQDALRVLGDTPPPAQHPMLLAWFESRIQAQAGAGDLSAVQASFEAWRARGGDPLDLRARYALRLSVAQLHDPAQNKIDLLREALAEQARLRDPHLVWGLHRRLISELLAAGRPQDALDAYDAAIERVELPGITRAELVRALRRAQRGPATGAPARARFVLPAPLESGRWWLSPGPEAPPDAGYARFDARRDVPVELELVPGRHPRRWILRDENGAVRASGAFWPEAGETNSTLPVLQPPAVPRAPASRGDRKAGDGRRRVFAILADCGDWRLTEYLRHRGDLPFQARLVSEGFRSVLKSSPAFTAAALRSLVWPGEAESAGTLGWIHQLGLELAGLEAVGRNPVGFLAAVLPERPNLFETLGAGARVTANMLLAHGHLDAGRHAEVVGPYGQRSRLPSSRAQRPLRADELGPHPGLLHDAATRRFAETIAAEMDAAERIADEGRVDFLFLRLEALDLITHGHFAPLDGAGQDDARGPLLDAYRYIDTRLADLSSRLDEDDWLVVLSDHGIRSAMQHEEDAIFVVHGGGVPNGRAPGQPDLRGVPGSLAAMFDLATDWPRTGATPWLRPTAEPDALAARATAPRDEAAR